ncbi:hypothetical protein M2130_001278 [Polynucleobacter sphagniphilus]|nr:hypothetical protein [Polynucleobacter sphagniphilus]MDH6524747.1 hypothetical protein [Polynucleobacter sphagniphilus]
MKLLFIKNICIGFILLAATGVPAAEIQVVSSGGLCSGL